jgi:tartrate dehydratase alpha subunit/fumarate hydratase class I-like protein
MIVVIVILCIAAGITINFLASSLRVYTMTVNQKTLYDEAKLSLEQMCRGIRDASSITSPASGNSGSSITFVRTNKTLYDAVGETITYQLNAGVLQKVKAQPASTNAMANNVTAFGVTNATNLILLTLTLNLATGENVTLQTEVYPKNLVKDLTHLNFYSNWMEYYSS